MSGVNFTKYVKRRDDRIIVHFDYDCFYASVVENENPALKSQPLAIQQKQIVVTCNYEARRRGLRKMQLIVDAKRTCPDVIIVLGEDLTRFRNASKELYSFIRNFSWNDRVERLGFDEVWMDVTDVVEYNLATLNKNDLPNSFFQLSKSDPMQGFAFDASKVAGHVYDEVPCIEGNGLDSKLKQRLILGSHFALFVRHQLEEHKGYTCTVGISTNKLISKLVGNLNKPKGQTTLLPPYSSEPDVANNVNSFLDSHDIGSIPYIGFKIAHKIREHLLGRTPNIDKSLIWGQTKEQVTVGDVRLLEDLRPRMLEELLSSPGMQRGIGYRTFCLIHGIDDTEVAAARTIPRQISIEDSYIRLGTYDQVVKQLHMLSNRLIERMRIDLTGDEAGEGLPEGADSSDGSSRAWLAKPSTLRLSTRTRPPLKEDGTRDRTFKRVSRSTHIPPFLFSLVEPPGTLAQKLVAESLLPLFRKIHPEKSGWDLSLVNVAVTGGMEERAESGGDIGSIFKRQVELRKEWESDVLPFVDEGSNGQLLVDAGEDDMDWTPSQVEGSVENLEGDNEWEEDGGDEEEQHYFCPLCESGIPLFAREAHERFHNSNEKGEVA